MFKLDNVLTAIADVRRADQVLEVLQRVKLLYGMRTVAYLGTGTLDRRLARREPCCAVTYSSEWVERYRARGYLKIDPVIQIGMRRLLPMDWDDFAAEDRSLRDFFGEATEFGLGRKGMSFPVHGHGGDTALFSVSVDASEREWQWVRRAAVRQFPIIATHLHDAVLRTGGASVRNPIYRPGSSNVCSGPQKARPSGNAA